MSDVVKAIEALVALYERTVIAEIERMGAPEKPEGGKA